MKRKDSIGTSWGIVADWYDNLLGKENTYQKDVILPELLKLMNINSNDTILDLACGQGFFTSEFAKYSQKVIGVDVSKELIEIAKKKNGKVNYYISPATNLSFIDNDSIDKITIILAIQNIEHVIQVFKECRRVLKNNGKMFIVLNHPAFRIPQKTDWGFDEKKKVQYRRIERYMSEIMTRIDMNPGEKNPKKKKYTVSFHRPIQKYFRELNNVGLLISKFEEWISNKKSQKGPRQKAEDHARKEIPIFACIEATKI